MLRFLSWILLPQLALAGMNAGVSTSNILSSASSSDTSGNTIVKRSNGGFSMGALTLGTTHPTLNFSGGPAKLGSIDDYPLSFSANGSAVFSLLSTGQMMFNSDPDYWDAHFFAAIPQYGIANHILDDVAAMPGNKQTFGNMTYYEITSAAQDSIQARNASGLFMDLNPPAPQTYNGIYAAFNGIGSMESNATMTGTLWGAYFAAGNAGSANGNNLIGGEFHSFNYGGGSVQKSWAGAFDSAQANGTDTAPHEAAGIVIGDTSGFGYGIDASGSSSSNTAAGIIIRNTITASGSQANAYAIKSDSTAKSAFAGPLSTPTLILNSIPFSNAPSAFWSFATGSLTSISANQIIGSGKTARAMIVENITGAAAAFSCTGNPVLTLIDCGTSAGSCVSGATTLGSVTLSGANSITAGSVVHAAIGAGHYFSWEITSGTCTALNATGSAEIAMQ